jgi:hypothetical protein
VSLSGESLMCAMLIPLYATAVFRTKPLATQRDLHRRLLRFDGDLPPEPATGRVHHRVIVHLTHRHEAARL